MQEYSVGGVAGMGELLAEANGIGLEYAALIRKFLRCLNCIAAGVDCFYYSDVKTAPYSYFNIKIGQKETAEVYTTLHNFALPYAVQAWIKNEPLQLHFIKFSPIYEAEQDRKNVAGMQFQVATKLKSFMKKCFEDCKSDWAISLQINYALGEIIIPKSE